MDTHILFGEYVIVIVFIIFIVIIIVILFLFFFVFLRNGEKFSDPNSSAHETSWFQGQNFRRPTAPGACMQAGVGFESDCGPWTVGMTLCNGGRSPALLSTRSLIHYPARSNPTRSEETAPSGLRVRWGGI